MEFWYAIVFAIAKWLHLAGSYETPKVTLAGDTGAQTRVPLRHAVPDCLSGRLYLERLLATLMAADNDITNPTLEP